MATQEEAGSIYKILTDLCHELRGAIFPCIACYYKKLTTNHRQPPSPTTTFCKLSLNPPAEIDLGNSIDEFTSITPIDLLRTYISSNKPVIIRGAVAHWPALKLWTQDYLKAKVGEERLVTVALTPDGRADAVTALDNCNLENCSSTGSGNVDDARSTASSSNRCAIASSPEQPERHNKQTKAKERPKDCFALPYEQKMPLSQFFDAVRSCLQSAPLPDNASISNTQQECSATCRNSHKTQSSGSGSGQPLVPYMQFQNNSLQAELPILLQDVKPDFVIATQALGRRPDAVNIWMGTEHSITTWHKDPYENFYACVSGSKTFYLLPPTDAFRMKLRRKRVGVWTRNDGVDDDGLGALNLKLLEPDQYTVWSTVQPRERRFNSNSTTSSHQEENCLVWGGKQTTDATITSSKHKIEHEDQKHLPQPLVATIYPGDILYLPGYWWHEVHQKAAATAGEGVTEDVNVSVNYWYDMAFDSRHCMIKSLDALAVAAGLNDDQGENELASDDEL